MYSKQSRNFQQLEISLASPKEIRSWAERFLPNGEIIGEVTSWETVNYKTLKPEPNGLFCQKIFGPIIDYTCACGKKAVKVNSGFCPKCGVERTSSQVRRYRMGYISLKQPVAHTLYSSQKPSPLGLCLNWPNKKLQAVLYGTEFCHLPAQFEFFDDGISIQHEWNKQNNRKLFKRKFFIKQPSASRRDESVQRTFGERPRAKASSIFEPFSAEQTSAVKQISQSAYVATPSVSSRPCVPRRSESSIPKLFRQDNSKKTWTQFTSIYSKNKLSFGIHIYGIAHDMAWRQVEDLQQFLMYMWEQPRSSDGVIPYYFSKKLVRNFAFRTIPSHPQYYPIQTGAFVFQKIFSHYNLIGLQRQLSLDLNEAKRTIIFLKERLNNGWHTHYGGRETIFISKQEKTKLQIEITRFKELEKKLLRRLTYFRDFYKAKLQPSWMVLSYLPVLPPGLRPITSIRGELVVSDLNSLYRKVLTRNRRLTNSTRFSIFDTALSGSWASWCYNLRQVQESVDSLLKTGKIESGKTTKSLLDALKGKRGRFRQHLLGKRVDYSGRSVIVVGPELKIHECGIPKQMAVELFQPFLIQQLRNKGIAFTTTGAKAIINERKPIIWRLLGEILQSHPVLLNRAPTLHRLGIQAFIPKLVDGKAILLHPLVCPAFNADFDGDQMAVHVPLSPAARAEAFNLLLASNHLLSPASGQPLLLPTQDMILGCYYLTISKDNSITNTTLISNFYSNLEEVVEEYQNKRLNLHTPIWVKWDGKIQNFISEQQAHDKNLPFEIRIDIIGNKEFYFPEKYLFQNTTKLNTTGLRPVSMEQAFEQLFFRTTSGRVLLHNLIKSAV